MFGEAGEALYVGKARSLKKRVIQYAQGRFHTNRIGHMVADSPLVKVVGSMALQAGLNDRRFTPLREEELTEVELEISVLTPARSVSGPEEIVLSITDTGEGMERDVLARVFEPYFSTKASGTGLGLPIAKKIVEDHGGTIEASSRPGQGTLLRLRFPRPQR